MKGYKEAWEKYVKILSCQENFNEKITKFLKLNREYLTNLVESDSIRDKDKIGLLLRYYLFKIVDQSQNPTSGEYSLTHFDKETFDDVVDIENPFPEKKEIIIQDLIKRYADLANQIKDFDKNIRKLNDLITNFQVHFNL